MIALLLACADSPDAAGSSLRDAYGSIAFETVRIGGAPTGGVTLVEYRAAEAEPGGYSLACLFSIDGTPAEGMTLESDGKMITVRDWDDRTETISLTFDIVEGTEEGDVIAGSFIAPIDIGDDVIEGTFYSTTRPVFLE